MNTSGGRDETGESALRGSFNARTESSNDLISASMALCRHSREFAWVEFIKNKMCDSFGLIACRGFGGLAIFARTPLMCSSVLPTTSTSTQYHLNFSVNLQDIQTQHFDTVL